MPQFLEMAEAYQKLPAIGGSWMRRAGIAFVLGLLLAACAEPRPAGTPMARLTIRMEPGAIARRAPRRYARPPVTERGDAVRSARQRRRRTIAPGIAVLWGQAGAIHSGCEGQGGPSGQDKPEADVALGGGSRARRSARSRKRGPGSWA